MPAFAFEDLDHGWVDVLGHDHCSAGVQQVHCRPADATRGTGYDGHFVLHFIHCVLIHGIFLFVLLLFQSIPELWGNMPNEPTVISRPLLNL
jgi:hypothetical protein